jgi:hypothetical protein
MTHFNFKDRVGEKHTTNEGYTIEIIDYNGVYNCSIKFDCGLILNNIGYGNIVKGTIRNPLHKSVHKIGYLGIGKYNRTKNSKCYYVWNSMICRSFCEKYNVSFPTYKDITVCEEWKCFQNFAEWFYKNYKEGFELDKDILIKGNKTYSPETCAFVPQEVNYLFTKRQNKRGLYPIGVSIDKKGKFRATFTRDNIQAYLGKFNTPEEAFQAYKKAKENYIKQKADEWKDLIDPRVYQAMYNYQVEITD